MQADCFAEYLQCTQENSTEVLSADLVCTASLITCVNAHLYSSVGEHLVDRPGEGNVTGKAFLEAGLVVKALERHATAVQTYANRARSVAPDALELSQPAVAALERDLDEFVQTIIQDLQHHHLSD